MNCIILKNQVTHGTKVVEISKPPNLIISDFKGSGKKRSLVTEAEKKSKRPTDRPTNQPHTPLELERALNFWASGL